MGGGRAGALARQSRSSCSGQVQQLPVEVMLQIWLYLMGSAEDLSAAELSCRSWWKLMQQRFWDLACSETMVPPGGAEQYGSKKFAFLAHAHHFHWLYALWGDFPSSYVSRSDSEDYLLYDTFPDVGFLYAHALLMFTVPQWADRMQRRELWLRSFIPENTLGPMLDPTGGHPPPGDTFCMRRSRFRCEATAVKTDLCGSKAAMMTLDGIEIFSDPTPAVPVGSEAEAFPSEDDAGSYLGPVGTLDCDGIPCRNIAVLHLSGNKVWALLKCPQGIQTWCNETYRKLDFYPVPGHFSWPADDPLYTWKSQERFCFKDPSWFGVVVDEDREVWVLDTALRGGAAAAPMWARIAVEDSGRRCPFVSWAAPRGAGGARGAGGPSRRRATLGDFTGPRQRLRVRRTPAAPDLSQDPAAAAGVPRPAGGGAWAGRDPRKVEDPSLPAAAADEASLQPRTANVRICGCNVLLWGGRGVLDEEEDAPPGGHGRAFVQLWRPLSTVNLNATSNDLVCTLDVKYDHILMCHCDAHRVYVMFHPFHATDPGMTGSSVVHTQHIAVDVWDSWGGGFVCRRIGHDEDRCPRPFFEYEDLTPAFIQILHAGPEELVYYCSQYKDDSNFLSVRQLGTLASAKERVELLAAAAEQDWRRRAGYSRRGRGASAAAAAPGSGPPPCPWWSQLAPSGPEPREEPRLTDDWRLVDRHFRVGLLAVPTRAQPQADSPLPGEEVSPNSIFWAEAADSPERSDEETPSGPVQGRWWLQRSNHDGPNHLSWEQLPTPPDTSESASGSPAAVRIGVLRPGGAAGHTPPRLGRTGSHAQGNRGQGTCAATRNRSWRVPVGAGWLTAAQRLREATACQPCDEGRRRRLRGELTLHLVAHLLGSRGVLNTPALLQPPLRPDFAALRRAGVQELPPVTALPLPTPPVVAPEPGGLRQMVSQVLSEVGRRSGGGAATAAAADAAAGSGPRQRSASQTPSRSAAVAVAPAVYAHHPVVSTQLANYNADRAADLQQVMTVLWGHLNLADSAVRHMQHGPGADDERLGPLHESPEERRLAAECLPAARETLLALFAGAFDYSLHDFFVHVPQAAALAAQGVQQLLRDDERQQQHKG
eukprot:TRINITY_DN25180_c0_g1_i1.p1 TRINITY_DN25180_c0_g1~~TRINITY_DN25180_c0_g1_i1.p1  ORF type:complete len:1141 (+),score=256.65 TRINITY_DN25180_c0_g1_i1:115-3423(+)